MKNSKETFGPGVRVNLRPQGNVRIRFYASSHRSGGHTGIGTQCELISHQTLYALVGHQEQNHIRGLGPNLKTEAASG